LHFTLTDLLTDITQNGAESGGTEVLLDIRKQDDGQGKAEFRFTVTDNGKGMTEEELKPAKDPFVTDGIKHPHRKVGLGIPFLIQTAEQSGGGCDLRSKKGEGTTVSAWFDLNNVDTPPVGDIPGMFRTILLFEGPRDVVLSRFCNTEGRRIDYKVRKSELLDALGCAEETADVQSLALMDQYLRSLEENDDD